MRRDVGTLPRPDCAKLVDEVVEEGGNPAQRRIPTPSPPSPDLRPGEQSQDHPGSTVLPPRLRSTFRVDLKPMITWCNR